MNLSKEKIKEIAEHLDGGMICYIHKQTHEIKEIIDLDEYPDGREFWEEDLKEIEANIDDYFKMEKIPSRDSFRIMAAFVETLSPSKIKWRLESILERKRPFRNFKDEVDYNENIRQQWFKFKDWKYQEWVKEYIENHFEEEDIEPSIPFEGGYFDDDGNRQNPDLHPLPSLCQSCQKKDDPSEEMLCNMTRLDQLGKEEFICFTYKDINDKKE
ncbi:MAG: hypothetical protein ACI94Y_000966 [Maribacter sp.]|jgi:hypothetical protein